MMTFLKLTSLMKIMIKKPFLTVEQQNLADYAGHKFPKQEAEYVWKKVLDHKWYLSEQLGRDVGYRMAAIDFVENLYKPSGVTSDQGNNKRIPFKVFSQYDLFADVYDN